MAVDTKSVAGRRTLRFQSMDDVVADAERLVAAPQLTMLGNWSLGRLLGHLARAINGSIDGVTVKAPLYVRLVAPLLKRRIIRRGLSPGFRVSKELETKFFPAVADAREGLDQLRAAAARTRDERMTSPHPVFGRVTHDEWLQLHLRHAEMHLSFALPE